MHYGYRSSRSHLAAEQTALLLYGEEEDDVRELLRL